MVNQEDIQATCDEIVRIFEPLQVILFGSYAYGTPNEDSDVDLLVVMDIADSETHNQASKIRKYIKPKFSLDLLVRSPEEIAYRIFYNDWFLTEITQRGKILYGNLDILEIPVRKEKSVMNPLTFEWIQKAEGDYSTIKLLLQSPISSKDVICFHAQQCIEKYLKAWLQENRVHTPKSHNLEELLNLIVPFNPSWSSWKSDFSILTNHAVDFRYPGRFASDEDVEHATRICDLVRDTIRDTLNIPNNS